MRLFEIDEDDQLVKLNKEWIQLVPEFANLMKPERNKGTKGDSEGRYKLRARKEFTFIYFMVDFAAPTRDWEESEKWKESLYCAGLTDEDIDEPVLKAKTKYKEYFLKSARSLRTYNAMQTSLDQIDSFFEQADLTKENKRGELIYSVTELINAGKKAEEFYVSLKNMEKRVEEDLTAGAKTIRGTAELGDNETKKTSSWSESEIGEQSQRISSNSTTKASFTDLSQVLKQQ